MAGFSAGSVFVQVVPSLDNFGRETRAKLAGENLSADVELNPNLDEKKGQAQADAAARKMSGKNVRFDVKLDTREAEGGLGRIAAYTAGGVLGFAGLSTAALGAVGIIGTLAIPIAAVKLGMDGIKAAAAPLKPQFDALKTAVAGAFQTGLQPAIANIRVMLPSLQAGLVGTAGSLSLIASQVAHVVTSGVGLAQLQALFAAVNQTLRGLAPVIATLVGSFLRMGMIFAQTFAAVMVPMLQRFAQAFGQMVNQLAGSGQLQAAFSGLFQVIGALLSLLPPLIAAGVRLMAVIGPPLAFAINAVAGALQFLQPILPFIIGAIAAWVVVQWAINAALAANPIVLIAIALGALVVAVIYCWQHFQMFRDIVLAVWNAIQTAVSVAWTILSTIFNAIVTVLSYVGLIIGVVLVAPFVIAWNIISAIALAVWARLQAIWYGAMVPALQFLGGVFSWLWQNIVVPVWNGISNAISIAWAFISGVFSAIGHYLSGVLGPVFEWLWHNIIQPVWSGISSAINAAYVFIRDHVFRPLGDAINAVGRTFQSVADWIARAWDSIREAARRPVQWVVDVVYNNGIRPVWNGIAGLFGMAQLGPVHMATGGVLPGYAPGRDSIPAILSAGEGVLVPEAVRGLGPAFVGWANSHFSGGRSSGGVGTPQGGGFSKGGVAHFADGGILDGIMGLGKAGLDFFMNIFSDASGAVKKLFGGVLGDGERTPGQGSWTGALKQLPVKTVDAVIAMVKKWVADLASMGGLGGAGVERWAPIALEALALAGQAASNLPLLLMQMRTESGGNPFAINLWDSNAARGTPSKGLMQVIDPTFAAYAGPLRGLGIWNPLANIYAAIKYTVARYGSLARGWHGHGYDNGGWLPPGPSITYNNTGRPEPVLTRQQWADVSAAARYGRGGPIIENLYQQLPDGASSRRFAEDLTFEIRRIGLTTGVHG